MPDQTPNNAGNETVDRTEIGEPAAALQDIAGGQPGGGGLGGASAAEAAPHAAGGTARNSPIDVPVRDEEARAASEAAARAAADETALKHPTSL